MKAAELDSLFARYGEVMTPFEIATTVRCSDSHIYELLTRGDLPCFCVGRHYRILKTDAIYVSGVSYRLCRWIPCWKTRTADSPIQFPRRTAPLCGAVPIYPYTPIHNDD